MNYSALKQQLLDQKKNSYFFNAIRRVHRKQEELNKIEYDWEGRGFKVYPSSIDFGMCPYAYFRNHKEYEENRDPIMSSYRKSRGSALHKEFQTWFLKSNIIAPRPNIKLEYPKNKLKKLWPEVPILYEPAMVSGQADGVMLYKNQLCILEFKSKNEDEKDWEETIERRLPMSYHVAQAAFYADIMTEQEYWNQPVEWLCIAYLNTRFKPGDPKAEKEFYLPYDNHLKGRVSILKEHLVKERDAFINKIESFCTYPGCKICRKL